MSGVKTIVNLLFMANVVFFLFEFCLCKECSQYRENSTGPLVLHEINASQVEIHMWSTGNFYRLSCCFSGNPQPNISWSKDGDIIDFGNYRMRLEDASQTVWIGGVRTTDSGNYTCTARNGLASLSHTLLVHVKSSFQLQKPVVILQPNSWQAHVGRNITLPCIIKKSSIKPLVTWKHKKNNSITLCDRNHITVLQAEESHTWLSNLTIVNITREDEGTYICEARNGAGVGEAAHYQGKLTVLGYEMNVPHKDDSRLLQENGPIVSILIGVVCSLAVMVLVVLLCRHKRRSRSHSNARFLLDDLSFHKPGPCVDQNPLIMHEDGVHIEIPKENLQLRRENAAETSGVDFDVFISYSSADRDLVKNVLYTELTKTHSVCIDFKDFEAGLYITDNIANSVFRSRKTLLVVTRNFLRGVWTFFEMQLAQGRLSQGHDVLIPVIVENISVDELPKPLQHYRTMKTYLEYFNEDVGPHFWDRLRSALGPSLREPHMASSTSADVSPHPS